MGKKKVTVLSEKNCDINTLKSVRLDIGKKVISKSGERIGRVKDVLCQGDRMTGLLISNGFSSKFIAKEFIESSTKRVVLLNIDPIYLILGKKVFDAEGKKIGKVVDIVRPDEDNSFEELVIKKNIFSKKYVISKNDIATFKKNVILNKAII